MDDVWLKTSRRVHEIEQCIKDDIAHLPMLYDLPIATLYVLASLYEKDDQRASDLAKSIGMPATSFTPTIDRLEKLGLIARSNNSTDRRSVLLSLTQEGKKYRAALENAIANAEVRYGDK